MNNTNNLESLLHDYIDVFRGIQRQQSSAMLEYINAQREMNTSLSNLLQRYLDIHGRYRNIRDTTTRMPPITPPLFSFPNTNTSTFPNNTTFPNSTTLPTFNRGLSQSPINNTSYNFSWPSNNTSTSTSTSTSTFPPFNRSQPTNRYTPLRTRRIRPRIRTRTTTTRTTIPSDVFQNFINNTLNMGNIPQPLTAGDISSNITNLTYGDIAETTNQTICPFTQENFINSDEISRINPCGHIFTRSHLNRYLTNFDHRCPICRRDLRRENDVENPPVNNSQSLIDLSGNHNTNTRNIINNAVESVTNALMSNLTNQINRDPSSNTYVAEYSFLIPALSNNNSNDTQINTNMTNTRITNTPLTSLHLHDLLGINRNSPIQNPLPPLPEDNDTDTDTEMPELIENFSDDEDL